MLPLLALLRRIAEPTPFIPPLFPPPEIFSVWEILIVINLSKTQMVLLSLWAESIRLGHFL